MFPRVLLRKTSLIDYPGRISSVFFLPGCNLRCPWCHNRNLVLNERPEDFVSVDDALGHLRKRRNVLGGVVLSGGEPCIHNELPGLVAEIKKLSFPVKLDTNGMFPLMLERLFRSAETRPDYIALDLKIAPGRYAKLKAFSENPDTPEGDPEKNLLKSAALIKKSGIAHEYRTLALPDDFITVKDIENLAPLTDDAPWYFRPFRGGGCLDPAWDSLEETAPGVKAWAGTLAGKAAELGKNALCP